MTGGSRTFPRACAVTVPGAEGPEAAAAEWTQQQRRRLSAAAGAQVLIHVPDQDRFSRASAAVHRLALETGVSTQTWKGFHSGTWPGGIVLALSPDLKHLHTLDDHPRTLALAVVADQHQVNLWAAAKQATILGGLKARTYQPPIDLVVAAAISDRRPQQDHQKLMGAQGRRHCAQALHILQAHGYRLDPDQIYTEALRQGWLGHHALQLHQLVEAINTGKQIGQKGHPSTPTVHAWRQQAAAIHLRSLSATTPREGQQDSP